MYHSNFKRNTICKKTINRKKDKYEESQEDDKNVGELFKNIFGATSNPHCGMGRVYCEENHIYFYDDVNTNSILELVKHIKNLNRKIKLELADYNILYDTNAENTVNIYLHINSFGGFVFDSLAAVDTIISSEVPIISIIEGCAASAATFLSIVCQKRQMREHASMLIHQLSGGFWGTFEQMKDDIKNSKYLMKVIKDIYMKHTNDKLSEDKLDEVLQRDIWWSPKKCKKYGLIDEIV